MSNILKDSTLLTAHEFTANEFAVSAHDASVFAAGTELDEKSGEELLPSVSVVIPCYNEERFIATVLENLLPQYPSARMEIIVVDGMSEDGTRAAVNRFIEQHREVSVRLIDNPARVIPVSLNLGIAAATNEIIVRMDAHSVPSANYVREGIAALQASGAQVVGMPCRITPGAETRMGRAIALVVAHPFGIGDAKYRAADVQTQYVDTVPFGIFRKELWTQLGGFNEELLANEDYDFYYRVRREGGRVLLNADAHITYFARPTLRALAKQYARYGGWKAQMVKLHPRSIRVRQVVAPAFVSSLVFFGVAGVLWHSAWVGLALILAAYGALALWFAFKDARKCGELALAPFIALVFFVVHVTWGGSFLRGLVRSSG